MNNRLVLSLILPCTLALALSGCQGKGSDTDNAKAAAKVNGDAISVPQVEATLGQLREMDGEQRQQAANQVLNRMIDQQLLAQQAIAAKLDQGAEVRAQLEVARRQILAEAQVERLAKDAAKPADTEIGDYYAKHPELFAERKIYRLQEVIIGATAENIASVREKLAGVKSLNEFAQWAQKQGIPLQARQAVKAAEELPTELLARLKPLAEGGFISLDSGGKLSLIIVAGLEKRPATLEQAKPAIERHLLNSKKRELVKAALEALRGKAKIEYVEPYQAIAVASEAKSGKE